MRRRREIFDAAKAVGLPDAQRDPDELTRQKVPQIGTEPRTVDYTVKRLTRVERLRNSGVLELHEAAACEWYADIAALAWDTLRVTANYDPAGGGGGATAPDYLMAKTHQIAEARDDYRFAVTAIPAMFLPLFEAVVCKNLTIAAAAKRFYGQLARSQSEHKVRSAVKMCANLLHGRIAHRLPII